MIVLGIDPGQTGGLALVDSYNGGFIVEAMAMPVMKVGKKKSLDITAALLWMTDNDDGADIDVGVIEKVHAMPKQGVSSSFQFGRMFGSAEAIMYISCVQKDYVAPRVWKKDMGLTSDKHASMDLATRLFGDDARKNYWQLKKHEGVAEAALIALWWIRKYL